MIPSRDTAHLVQDPAGNWIVVGTPKPAEGVPPPPLNAPLPEEGPPAPPPPPAPRVVEPRELTVRIPPRPAAVPAQGGRAGAACPVAPAAPPATAPGVEVPHAAPGPLPALGPLPVAPPVVAPVAPVAPAAPVADQPLTAPLDAAPRTTPSPVACPGRRPNSSARPSRRRPALPHEPRQGPGARQRQDEGRPEGTRCGEVAGAAGQVAAHARADVGQRFAQCVVRVPAPGRQRRHLPGVDGGGRTVVQPPGAAGRRACAPRRRASSRSPTSRRRCEARSSTATATSWHSPSRRAR